MEKLYNMILNGKYMWLMELAPCKGKKTPSYLIFEKSETHGLSLGEIKWYAPWRGFCFFPEKNTVFDKGCALQIAEWIEIVNKEYKKNKIPTKEVGIKD